MKIQNILENLMTKCIHFQKILDVHNEINDSEIIPILIYNGTDQSELKDNLNLSI